MKKIVAVFCLSFIFFATSFAQPFTHADTLRGSNGAGRAWWDATKYDLHVKFDLQDSTISGYNIISFKVLKKNGKLFSGVMPPSQELAKNYEVEAKFISSGYSHKNWTLE